jgi:KUP system potassium uptake protein
VAVTTTMVITTMLLYFVMRERWKWTPTVSLSLTALFLVVDVSFFAANIVKVPAGGWFPLVVGGVMFFVMTTWKLGRTRMTAALKRGDLPIERFIGSITTHPQLRVPGTAAYLFPDPGVTPPALLANLRHNEVLHETVVLVSVQTSNVPRVPQVRRATVHELGEGFVQVVLHFGFMDEPDVPRALSNIVDPEFGFDSEDAAYFLGRETIITKGRGIGRWRAALFALMHRNSSSAVQYFSLPPEQVIEIGRQVAL